MIHFHRIILQNNLKLSKTSSSYVNIINSKSAEKPWKSPPYAQKPFTLNHNNICVSFNCRYQIFEYDKRKSQYERLPSDLSGSHPGITHPRAADEPEPLDRRKSGAKREGINYRIGIGKHNSPYRAAVAAAAAQAAVTGKRKWHISSAHSPVHISFLSVISNFRTVYFISPFRSLPFPFRAIRLFASLLTREMQSVELEVGLARNEMGKRKVIWKLKSLVIFVYNGVNIELTWKDSSRQKLYYVL